MLKERLKNADMRTSTAQQESSSYVKELELKLRQGETERRKMHNVIQELRGNVRVFARIRPFLPSDNVEPESTPAIQPTKDFSLSIGEEGNKSNFNFDKVFAPSIGQEVSEAKRSEAKRACFEGGRREYSR